LTWFYPGGSGADAEPAQTTTPVSQPPASIEDAAEEATAEVSEPTPTAPEMAVEQTPPLLAGASGGLGPDAAAANNAATTSASDLAKPLHVEISITAKVWVQAVADGVRIFEDILEPGATRSIQASDSVRLVVGNAAGVTVALNGKVLPPIGPSGQVRRVVLTSTGMEIDRIEPNRPPGETASDAPFETRNPARGSVPALAIAKPER
jgi:hypothetical protein